jgi:hypothetical protein
LLPYFDVYIVGGYPRDRLIPAEAPPIFRKTGTAAGFTVMLVDGVMGGCWKQSRNSKRLEIRVDPFVTLSSAQRDQLEARAKRIGEILEARSISPSTRSSQRGTGKPHLALVSGYVVLYARPVKPRRAAQAGDRVRSSCPWEHKPFHGRRAIHAEDSPAGTEGCVPVLLRDLVGPDLRAAGSRRSGVSEQDGVPNSAARQPVRQAGDPGEETNQELNHAAREPKHRRQSRPPRLQGLVGQQCEVPWVCWRLWSAH